MVLQSFDEFREVYYHVDRSCGTHGRIYHYSNTLEQHEKIVSGEWGSNKKIGTVTPVFCDSFVCERCRKKLKAKLKNKVDEMVKDDNLVYHFVITTEGKKYRDFNSWQLSYIHMAKNWNVLRNLINYYEKKEGRKNLSYLLFPRSQKTGYCHYHILLDRYIDENFLKKKMRKYKNMGFMKIKTNMEIKNYMTNHFLKDHEYVIPLHLKHYVCSRDLSFKLHQRNTDLEWKECNMYINDKRVLDYMVNAKYCRAVPFELLIGDWV